jgi:hypothetical protein
MLGWSMPPMLSRRLHWESWLLRLVLVGVLALQLTRRNTDGAVVAGEGVAVSLLPLLVQKLSKTHVPRALEFAFTLGMMLQFVSESTKLFEVFYYWDKLVHPTLVALTAMVAAWLLLGYRDAYDARISARLSLAVGWLVGASVGAFWEFVEFTSDWLGNTDLQKSNGDTMTDMLSNDIGAFVAILIGAWIYFHWLGERQRDDMGRVARWIGHGPAHLLSIHGRLVASVCAAVVVGLIGTAWWIDRATPVLATGLAQGGTRAWAFTAADDFSSPSTQVLDGEWETDQQAGICRVDLENGVVPTAGSEKMGLLELGPGTIYGVDGQIFTIGTDYFELRPPKEQGTQMDGGIAFGIHDDRNFYLLEESALHDILRLDRYVNGKRRDVREKPYRTHGNEWHSLLVRVDGDSVAAGIDGSEIYAVRGLSDTSGGIGLWARTSASTCFKDAQVEDGGQQSVRMPLPSEGL